MASNVEWGKIYFCPTPIGHLRDITLRTLDVFRGVYAIVCEDTRVTRKLLAHYDIHKPLISYYACNTHSRQRSLERLNDLLKQGRDLALVTDAGSPGIQDPGQELVGILEQEGICIEMLPGPSALLPAVVLSGFASKGFVFLGFLPRKRKERTAILERYMLQSLPVIVYESPHRVMGTLQELALLFGNDREIFLCRELSKLYEERIRGRIGEVMAKLSERESVKGESVLVVRGLEGKPDITLDRKEEIFLLRLLETGMSKKEAVSFFSSIFPTKKNSVKQFLHSHSLVDFTPEN